MSLHPPQQTPGFYSETQSCVFQGTPPRNLLWIGLVAIWGSFIPVCSNVSLAEQGLELVAGFDSSRVQTAWEDLQSGSPNEVAKLLFRLKKISPKTWDQRSSNWDDTTGQDEPNLPDQRVGQLIKLEGEIASRKNLNLAPTISDLLGIKSLSVLTVRLSNHQVQPTPVEVICLGVPREASPGDRISLNGMVIHSSMKSIASPTVSWHPKRAKSASWQWLSDHGMNIGLLPSLANRDRHDLSAQDGDAFDVDYTSCAVRGPMEDGVFSHSMEITNEFDSVIAVVWFQDSSLAPLHQIFTVDGPVASADSRGIRKAGDRNRVIVWK